MSTRTTAIAFTAALAVYPASVTAHPEYEREARSLIDKSGRELHIMLKYADGIFSVDPVKLVVRNTNNELLDETEYGRDIALTCNEADDCVVYRYENGFSLLPAEIFQLKDSTLIHVNSRRLLARGALMPLLQHPVGHIVTTGLVIASFWVFRRAWRSSKKWLLVFAVLAGASFILGAIYAIAVLSRLSLPLIAALTGVISVATLATSAIRGTLRRQQ